MNIVVIYFGNNGREATKLPSLLKHWKITLFPTGVPGWLTGFHCSPVASTVSHFTLIWFLSNLNDWLIAD